MDPKRVAALEECLNDPEMWATELYRRAGWLRKLQVKIRIQAMQLEAEELRARESGIPAAVDFRRWADQRWMMVIQLIDWADQTERDANQAAEREARAGQAEPGWDDEDPLNDNPEEMIATD